MSHDLNPDEQPDDVLFHITTLRMMSAGTEMPKRWHEGFWRVMDRAHAEITRLRAENRALRTGKASACQHDTTAPAPTIKPQYPGADGSMQYWCSVCSCWFSRPLSSADSERPR